MKKNYDGQKPSQGPKSGRGSSGFIPTSFRAFSRIVCSGAWTVASTVRTAASAIVDGEIDSSHDQVLWAGFDKLECEDGTSRQILLLGCQYGFQVWDVEDSDSVHNLVSRQDGPVSFMQVLPKPIASKKHEDKFSGSHPVLTLCAGECFPGGSKIQEGIGKHHDGTSKLYYDQTSIGLVPTAVWFYSLTSHSYVHQLKFRSVVHLVRCSSRVIAILQAAQVIVRDIISKELIAQFRAHNSPISALCFDPSGTLLVTASVQGHNINVFRIMPVLSENTSPPNPGSSYVHLYRLQRGLTNAVIQGISFSSDSQWIMISSSRGTSHLFTISPSGEVVNFRSSDACITGRSNGSSVMAKPAVYCASNSKTVVLNQQNICESGPPVTLSVVGRIRSGSNGWRNTVTGAAAAATGWTSSFSGSTTAIALISMQI